MGTNFYIRGFRRQYEGHVGKRSAAGPYCWDCKTTLCEGGEENVHDSHFTFFDDCPKCGQELQSERIDHHSVGRELGFNKADHEPKAGVKSCSSFSWAMDPEVLKKRVENAPICSQCERLFDNEAEKVIEDEYGDLYSWEEFQNVLSECPIQRFSWVGEKFS